MEKKNKTNRQLIEEIRQLKKEIKEKEDLYNSIVLELWNRIPSIKEEQNGKTK